MKLVGQITPNYNQQTSQNNNKTRHNRMTHFSGKKENTTSDTQIKTTVNPTLEYYKAGLGTIISAACFGAMAGFIAYPFLYTKEKDALSLDIKHKKDLGENVEHLVNKFDSMNFGNKALKKAAIVGGAITGVITLLMIPFIKNSADQRIQEKTLDAETTAAMRQKFKDGDVSDRLIAASLQAKATRDMAKAQAQSGGDPMVSGLAAGAGFGLASNYMSSGKSSNNKH